MPCHTRMKIICLQGLLWLYILEFGLMVMSLEPGFLDFDNLPDTNFSCVGKVIGGYYADVETNCQMFHVCTIGQLDEPMDIRFLCLNGTVFDQETRVCERIDEVDCSKSEQFYSLNLELYGNTQPPVLEESPETDAPFIVRKPTTTTTTTTTTTSAPTRSKTTSAVYYNKLPQTTTHSLPKEITPVHHSLNESPDIRFNPIEINVSLKPQSPPIIKTQIPRPTSFHHQSYVNNEQSGKVVVTTHASALKSNNPQRVPLLQASHVTEAAPRTEAIQSIHSFHNPTPKQSIYDFIHQNQHSATPTEVNFGFTFHNTETISHTTPESSLNYHFQHMHVDGLRPPALTSEGHSYITTKNARSNRFQESANRHNNDFSQQTTASSRTKVTTSKRRPHQYRAQNTDNLPLPLPAVPSLHPLAFSSPAPFSLSPRIENKRYTSNGHSPRIVISARASVSDNSGRRLNYSLGTIGDTELVDIPLPHYDEYKEEMEGLSFFDDVAREGKKERRKRNVEKEIDELIKDDDDAVDVLKYLYNWYEKHQTSTPSPTTSLISEINEKLAPKEQEIAESRGEYAVKTANNARSKGQINDKNDVTDAITPVSNFDNNHFREDFGTTFETPFNAYDNDNFDFPRENDNSFFGRDGQDSFFEIDNDFPPPPDMGEDKEEEDDKNGRKYTYKKIILSQQASNDDDKDEPNGKSIVKNNKVISHETFSEFTNFTDYTDDNDEPKIFREVVTIRNETKNLEDQTDEPQESTTLASRSRQRNGDRNRSPQTRRNYETLKRTDQTLTRPQEFTVNERYTTERYNTESYTTTERYNYDDYYIDDSAPKRYRTEEYRDDSDARAVQDSKYTTQDYTYNDDADTVEANTEQNIEKSEESSSYTTENVGDITETTVFKTERYTSMRYPYSTTQTTPSFRTRVSNFRPTRPQSNGRRSFLGLQRPSTFYSGRNSHVKEPDTLFRDYTDVQENFGSKIVDINSIGTTTLKSSLPIEDIFESVSTARTSDYKTTAATTEDPSWFESELSTEPGDISESVKKMVYEIEQKTKAVANEKDILSITSATTEYPSTVTTTPPETTTQPITARVATSRYQYSRTRPTPRRNNNSRRQSSRHRLLGNYGRTAETPGPRLLDELIQTVREAFSRTTTDLSLFVTDTTTARNTFSTFNTIEENTTDVPGIITESIEDTTTKVSDIIEESIESTTKETSGMSTTPEYIENVTNTPLKTDAEERQSTTEDESAVLDSIVTTTPKSDYTSTTILPPDLEFSTSFEELLTTEIPDKTTTTIATTTASSTTSTSKTSRRRNFNSHGRHRFSVSNQNRSLRRPSRLRSNNVIETSTASYSRRRRPIQKVETTVNSNGSKTNNKPQETVEVKILTEPPLSKSVSPTQGKDSTEIHTTTPFSKKKKAKLRAEGSKQLAFSCFEKTLNKFYPDPRDCRLFHYCSPGYSKSQIVDMKFVCDLGTFFDSEKLVCSKTMPSRCL